MKQPSHVAFVHNAGIQITISAENVSGCFCRTSPVGTDVFEKNSVIFSASLEAEDI